MTAFVAIGVVGVVLLLVSVIFDDLLDGLFDALDVDLGGGLFSLPVLAAFAAAFGLGGAFVMSAGGTGVLAACAGGAVAGTALAAFALRFTNALRGMATDETPQAADLVGKLGRVVTPIAAGSVGEILVRLGGQQLKLTARSAADLSTGTEVVVVEVLSPTSVLVEPAVFTPELEASP